MPHFAQDLELKRLAGAMVQTHLRSLFAADPQRFDRYSLSAAGLTLDYSKNLIDDRVLAVLVEGARQAELPDAIDALFQGQQVNTSERRAALHTLLRDVDNPLYAEPLRTEVRKALQQMARICNEVHGGLWRGWSGQPIRHVVNIGIGGSYLGLRVVNEALKPFARGGLSVHYLANIDPSVLTEIWQQIEPEATLFIVASKSFGTLETLSNARMARTLMLSAGCPQEALGQHFVAISTHIEAAVAFGIRPENILPLWDWVGGRYSLWSPIGLAIALYLGFEVFEQLLAGARSMDRHFHEAPLAQNMPVLMGLLGCWYRNYFGAQTHAVLPYDHYLRYLPDHLQQLDMESNGKNVDRAGHAVAGDTGPIIWGGVGCNGQHAYHQLLHQGTSLVPADFIVPLSSHNSLNSGHAWLVADAFAQAEALMQGKSQQEAEDELRLSGMPAEEAQTLAPHKMIPGNRPSNTLVMDALTPETLGALIALYEHKVYVQAVLWNINPFDQWGVELGKALGADVYAELQGRSVGCSVDSSTAGLIALYRRANGNSG